MTYLRKEIIGKVTLGDCVKVLAEREGPLLDACVTDPPYHLSSVVKAARVSEPLPLFGSEAA